MWAWGQSPTAQGNNTNSSRNSPVQVGTLSNWAQVSCGYYTTYAQKTDGTLWSWGRNANGGLGLSDTT